ncbi:GTPase-activating protein gyp8 [Kickxella alabastrina]|uniref:GTPase-activating protein gyp8 n=1 Tax=Kickxella alabastrina TaxID=61397 RepID=A0ACC1ICZ0_9FUNG|nr:GTPase-activating protein gyp8 [Kickxella alabastrina]
MQSDSQQPRRRKNQRQADTDTDTEAALTATHNSAGKPLTRAKRISQAISNRDLTTLKLLARTGDGFQTIRLRRRAWPLLLNFRSLTDAGNRAVPHPDEGQLALDILRTSLPQSPEYRRDASAVKRRQGQLGEVVRAVLRSYPWLSYYQGFHELSLTFLSVFGSERPATEAAKMVSLFLMRDAMSSDLDLVLKQLNLLYSLLETTSPKLHALLTELDVPAFFAISWVLTWFAHDLEEFQDICRIYDFLITMPPMQVIYMAAAMLKRNEEDIIAYDRDFAIIHIGLVKLPGRIRNWHAIIEDSYYMQLEFPPAKLQHMGQIILPKLSAVNTYEATWRRLDPARPMAFESLLPAVRNGRHPLAGNVDLSAEGGRINRMAGVIDLTNSAQKARNLALQHKWPLMVATVASATMLMYAWMLMQQLQIHP